MKNIPFLNIKSGGDLLRRCMLNYDRLEQKEYQPSQVFRDKEYSWPGDFEGRTILALVMEAEATGREPAYLGEIMKMLPDYLNELGYFGRILPQGEIDEQQLSGNSWFLRGLCEYYLWKRDESILRMIKSVVENLLLPLKGYYASYPVNPEDRKLEGDAIGGLLGTRIGCWYPSTDVGCAFIMLDGASQAFQLVPDSRLKELLEEMIVKFLSIDILGLSFQTHATLSALRGILRYYETVKRPELLDVVKTLLNLYFSEGMTENHANWNWFGRPHWTEPCGIIDSFILAAGVWRASGDASYLEEAHNIYFNALSFGQRFNGGFGCDVCAGAEDVFLTPRKGLFEAGWCCTMRGGEGLARAVEYTCLFDDSIVQFPFYWNADLKLCFPDGCVLLKETTEYPFNGRVAIEVVTSEISELRMLKFYIPTWVDESSIRITTDNSAADFELKDGFAVIQTMLCQGKRLELSFGIPLRKVATINRNNIREHFSIRHGALMLGMDGSKAPAGILNLKDLKHTGDGIFQSEKSMMLLEPVYKAVHRQRGTNPETRLMILFKE